MHEQSSRFGGRGRVIGMFIGCGWRGVGWCGVVVLARGRRLMRAPRPVSASSRLRRNPHGPIFASFLLRSCHGTTSTTATSPGAAPVLPATGVPSFISCGGDEGAVGSGSDGGGTGGGGCALRRTEPAGGTAPPHAPPQLPKRVPVPAGTMASMTKRTPQKMTAITMHTNPPPARGAERERAGVAAPD